ncbi:MAG: DUF3015 domain-containing protein [Nitrospirota bacterium]|nr:DUF3015 domain-containing protein [Nitrospirota bacterium]
MGKQTVVVFAALALMLGGAGVSLAGPNPDNGPGCGLGKLAWSDYSEQKHIAPQVLMATTNGTFGSQTFGISSGTSGCTNDGQIAQNEKVNVFAAFSFDNLSQEMAQGQGEHLTSLATLMGIPVGQQPAFFAMAQEKYTTLVQDGETSPKAVVEAIHAAMVDHPLLAQATTSK